MSVTPCRERVLAQLATLLGALPVPGLTVERERDEPWTQTDLPAIGLYEADEDQDAVFTGEDAYTLRVDIEGHASAATLLAARQAAGTLRAQVQQALLPGLEVPLDGGGAAYVAVTPGTEPPPIRAVVDCADPVSGFVLTVSLDYQTWESNPFLFACEVS